MGPDSVMRLQEWFVGWCVGNFGALGVFGYEPCEAPGADRWVLSATIYARTCDSRISAEQILEGVWSEVILGMSPLRGWVLVDRNMERHREYSATISLSFKWVGFEEEEIPTLKRTHQIEDDALQDHLRLLSIEAGVGVIEEAWAKAEGVSNRASEDHFLWLLEEGRLVARLHQMRERQLLQSHLKHSPIVGGR